MLQDAKISPLEAISSEICFRDYRASVQLPDILLCFEGMDGNQHLGRGDFRASRSWAPSYHRSAAVFCPVFLCCFFLARSAPAPKVGGWRNPPSALIPPWCCVQTAPEKVTSAELYLAAAVITHLNSHSVLAEMILPPNDVFPLLEQPQSSPGCGYLSLRTYFPSAKHR